MSNAAKTNVEEETLTEQAADKKEKVKEVLQNVRENLSHKLHDGTEKAQEVYEKVSHTTIDDVTKSVSNYVKDQPGKSLLIAGAVGLVAGLLIRGGRH